MKSLEQIQREFADYLNGNKQSAIREDIISDDKADAQERLGFYHDAYRLRLIEVLSIDYRGLHKLLGEEDFATMALKYISRYPSGYRSIRWFGIHLPEFLKNPESAFAFDEKLYEMAEFENAQNSVFDEKDCSIRTVEELAAIDPAHWSEITIEFVPACRRVNLHYNIPKIWVELLKDEESSDEDELGWHRQDHLQSWLIWRSHRDPRWRALDVDEAWAVDRLMQGQSFGDICSGLTEWLDEEHIPLRAVTILKTLIVDNLVQRISLEKI